MDLLPGIRGELEKLRDLYLLTKGGDSPHLLNELMAQTEHEIDYDQCQIYQYLLKYILVNWNDHLQAQPLFDSER